MGQSGGRPSASVTLLVAAALVSFAAGLWTNLAASTVDPAWIQDHRVLIWIGTGAFAVLAGVQVLRERGGAAHEAELEGLLETLAHVVETERQTFVDRALQFQSDRPPAAAVTFTDPVPQELSPHARDLLVHWQDVAGRHAGDLDRVTDFYQGLESGRLVVLGAPGAGKTVLLSHLVLGLIRDRAPAAPVPVLISLTSFDPGDDGTAPDPVLRERLTTWMAGRLAESYQVPRASADEMVRSGAVLPVLDGLDEMDPAPREGAPGGRPRALALVRALNAVPRRPVVLASRVLDYVVVSGGDDASPGRPGLLTDARHITLRPLGPEAITRYLTQRFAGRGGTLPDRWADVVRAVAPDGDLYQVLSSPWELFLAVTAYQANDSTPADMVGMSADELRDHLLAELIPAVIAADPQGARRGWSAPSITRWLAGIAHHLDDTGAGTEINMPELWRIGGRRWPRWVPTVVTAACMLPYVPYLAVRGLGLVDLVVGAALATYAVIMVVSAHRIGSVPKQFDYRRFRFDRPARLGALALGLLGGVVFSIALASVLGWVVGVALGLTGAVLATTYNLESDITASDSPRTLRTRCVRYAVVQGSAFALFIWVMVAAMRIENWPLGAVVGAGSGVSVGLVLGEGATWLRYAVGTRGAARRDLLPRNTTAFLTWCHARGLLRMSGVHLQFRHRRLQEWLAADGWSRRPDGAAVSGGPGGR
jgi:hypothetical protein